jgi:hypothetical protein
VPVRLGANPAITLTTDVNGSFARALPAGSYVLDVAAAGYLTRTMTVDVIAQASASADLRLRRLAPCQVVEPNAIAIQQSSNRIVTQTLVISNTGAADLAWSLRPSAAANSPSAACGTNALPWVITSSSSGTTPADSGSAVGIAFNSAGRSSGVYTGTLCLSSNDPLHLATSIPLTLTVNVSVITVGPTVGLTTTEAGGTATFSITLTSQPTAPVTIGVSSSNLAEGAAAPETLMFTAANWNLPQPVTITGVDDAAADGNVAYMIITAAASSADPNYNGVDPADVSVTNRDDDTIEYRVYLALGVR